MQNTAEGIKTMLKAVNLYHAANQLEDMLEKSLNKSLSYEKFIEYLLKCELEGRDNKRFQRRMKQASFPEYKILDEFDISEQQSLSQRQLNQLKELT